MENETKRQGQPDAQKSHQPGFDKDQPGRSPGQRQPDRGLADDRGNRKMPDDNQKAIPDLDEPDVEGVGNESGNSTKATTPAGKSRKP